MEAGRNVDEAFPMDIVNRREISSNGIQNALSPPADGFGVVNTVEWQRSAIAINQSDALRMGGLANLVV